MPELVSVEVFAGCAQVPERDCVRFVPRSLGEGGSTIRSHSNAPVPFELAAAGLSDTAALLWLWLCRTGRIRAHPSWRMISNRFIPARGSVHSRSCTGATPLQDEPPIKVPKDSG